jgi:hypothetical protein
MKTTLSIIGVLALVTSLTCAEEAPKGPKKPGKTPPDLEAIFKSIDKNGNGELSLEEFKSHHPPHKPGEGGPGKPRKPGKPTGEAPAQ